MSDLRMTKNDNWDDVEITWGAFRGIYIVLPLFCTFLFIPISMFCNALGMDVLSMWIIGGTPFLISVAVVVLFINGKPPSYGTDILKWWSFKAREHWYMKGWLDKPPILE
jgi:hypothetical protein